MNGDSTNFDQEQGGGQRRRVPIVVTVVVGIVAVSAVALLLLRPSITAKLKSSQTQTETTDEAASPVGQSTSPADAASAPLFSTFEQSGGTLPPRLIPLPEPEPPLPSGLNRLMTDEEKLKYGFPVEWQVKITTPPAGQGASVPVFEVISGPLPDDGGDKPLVKPDL